MAFQPKKGGGVDSSHPKLRVFARSGFAATTVINMHHSPGGRSPMVFRSLRKAAIVLLFALAAADLFAFTKKKDATQYGMGLIVNVPFPESQVVQVVQEVVQNGIIRGTKEYNKDEFVGGATPATSTRVYKEWTEGGKVFYKVRLKAIDPRNFKDSNDVGTLAVRYVVQAQGDKNTVLHIDAVFVEDFRHVSHPSDGSVEGAEYKDIHDHLDMIATMQEQTAEAVKEKEAQMAQKQSGAVLQDAPASVAAQPAVPPPVVPSPAVKIGAGATSPQTDPTTSATAAQPSVPAKEPANLEQQVRDLRQQVMRLVKAPGAPLKSAPFHTATTLQLLPTGAEVLIVISTTYWVGVETHDGQHGWILREELELAP